MNSPDNNEEIDYNEENTSQTDGIPNEENKDDMNLDKDQNQDQGQDDQDQDENNEEYNSENMEDIELGDKVLIKQPNGVQIVGKVYYLDDDYIKILPDGTNDRIVTLEFTDELIDNTKLIEKHTLKGFIRQQQILPDQILDGYKDGVLIGSFTVAQIDEKRDVAIIKDSEDAEIKLRFTTGEYTGIPSNELGGIDVFLVKEAPQEIKVEENQSVIPEEEPIEEDEDEIELVPVAKMTINQVDIIEDVPLTEVIYPSPVQRADALNDFLTLLTKKEQVDEKALRRIRTLMETFFELKQTYINYYENGMPKSINEMSIDTLAQLFNNNHVPLARPVLNVSKRQYFYADALDDETDILDDTDNLHFKIFEDDLDQYLNDMNINNGVEKKDEENVNVQFIPWLQNIINKYSRPWIKSTKTKESNWTAFRDTDFFRQDIPDIDNEEIEGYALGDLKPVSKKNPAMIEPPTTINYSYMRALGKEYTTDSKKNIKLLLNAEEASVKNYILFPLSKHASVGAIRTGFLAIDSEQSQHSNEWIDKILYDLGGIQDTPSSNGILSIGVDGNTLSNILFSDYLSTLKFSGYGMGDFGIIMRQFGVHDMEYNHQVAKVLQQRVDKTKNIILTYVNDLRKKMEETVNNIKDNPLFDGELGIMNRILSEPILVSILTNLGLSSASLSKIDLVKVNELMKEEYDLFLAAIGGQPTLIAKYRTLSTRNLYNKFNQNKRRREINKNLVGYPPKPIDCVHVKELDSIRKTKDVKKQMNELIKFITKYQGVRKLNWITCSKGDHNLICIHELIKLQQFLKPNDAKSLEKELVLNFYGKAIGDEYLCRNCGQPIKNIDFDQSIEFDDNGNPMMGRSEMVDNSAEKEEEIDMIISNLNEVETIVKKDASSKKIYFIIKDIASKLGINIDKLSFQRIIGYVQGYMNQTKFNKKAYTESAEEEQKKGNKVLDYNIFYSRYIVAATASAILIDIQTRIKPYVVKYTLPGCKPGFSGFPLGDNENLTGVTYMACCLLAINKTNDPWDKTLFAGLSRDVEKRKTILEKLLLKVMLEDVHGLLENPNIKLSISRKRESIIKIKEREDKAEETKENLEILPNGFFPRKITEVIIDGAAKVDGARSALWIGTANKSAKETANLIKDSPYMDITCCKTKINEPFNFWKNVSELPQLDNRKIVPNSNLTNSKLNVHFDPRPLSNLLVDVPKNIYYKVFMNICAKGSNMGRPHEYNTFKKCYWCDFQYPKEFDDLNNYIEKSGLSKEEQKKDTKEKEQLTQKAIEAINQSFLSQGIVIDDNTFSELLDATHTIYGIPQYKLPNIIKGIDRLKQLIGVNPAPSKLWGKHITNLLEELSKLRSDDSEGIAIALGEISTFVSKAYDSIVTKIKIHLTKQPTILKRFIEGFKKLYTMQFSDMIDIITSYFITQFNRLVTRLQPDAHHFIQKQYELDSKDIEVIINDIIKPNEEFISEFFDTYIDESFEFSKYKIEYFVKQLSAICFILKDLSPTNVIGGEKLLKYITNYALFVPLNDMLTSSIIPDNLNDPIIANNNDNLTQLTNMFIFMVNKYNSEYLLYSEEEIKTLLEARKEKELDNIIQMFDRMTPEDRAIQLMLKRLGLGRWAVGGTKAIREYNAEQQERERQERDSAGIISRPITEAERIKGYIATSDNIDTGAGYDNSQMNEDDY
jgi:hypothetical protein